MSERKKLKMVSLTLASEEARAGKAGAMFPAPATPDSEVRALPRRRRFSAVFRLALLEATDRAENDPGAIGALLRREGLYSSHLSTRRREREAGALAALGRARGRTAKFTSEQKRVAAPEAKIARLQRELGQARLIIEVQDNSARYWGFRRRRRTIPGADHECSTGPSKT